MGELRVIHNDKSASAGKVQDSDFAKAILTLCKDRGHQHPIGEGNAMRNENLEASDRHIAGAPASGGAVTGQTTTSPLVVLAIDDDTGTLEYYEAALVNTGVRIESSTDPLRGVELARTLNPDLTLLDITMPELDGMEALERIRLSTRRPGSS